VPASQRVGFPRRLAWTIVIGVLVFVAAACSDDGEATTGSTGVELGSGTLPASVPDGFPIPQSAVISSTLVDWDNERTEVIMRTPAESAAVVLFYDQNLERTGYTVISSESPESDPSRHVIVFTGNGIEGELDINPEGTQLARVVLTFTHA
jgi:hypothetical protein